jgi:hypothetical protein
MRYLAVARQLLGKHIPASMKTDTTVELLDIAFSMRSVLYQELDKQRKESRLLVLSRTSSHWQINS